MSATPRPIVVSGPSGVGKGTLLSRVLEGAPNVVRSVSCTTRPPRPREVDGVDYHFVDDVAFDRLVAEDALLEWAEVHGERYGTLESEVDRALAEGKSVLLEIDVQGALNVRRRRPDALLVFIEPPSMEELRRRLEGRGTESPDKIRLRLSNAERELALADSYDARIVNDDLDEATAELLALVGA